MDYKGRSGAIRKKKNNPSWAPNRPSEDPRRPDKRRPPPGRKTRERMVPPSLGLNTTWTNSFAGAPLPAVTLGGSAAPRPLIFPSGLRPETQDRSTMTDPQLSVTAPGEDGPGHSMHLLTTPPRGQGGSASAPRTPAIPTALTEHPTVGAFPAVIELPVISVVLDLDETLIAAGATHPDMPSDCLDVREIEGRDYIGSVLPPSMEIAVRPWAFRFLWHLKNQGFRTYVLTAGGQVYCDQVVQMFNETNNLIEAGVSCRSSNGHVRLKKFEMVLHKDDVKFALAVDNKRKAWDRQDRGQVVVITDYLPEWTKGQNETVLMQVLDRILNVSYRFEREHVHEGRTVPVGDILQEVYEEEEKARMAERTEVGFKFSDPSAEEQSSFLAFLERKKRQERGEDT